MSNFEYGLTDEEIRSNYENMADIFYDKGYSDPCHFIYEILQNADDAHASTVRFELFENRLEILHNGTPFTDENARRIRLFGRSDKSDNDETTGEFGVGFKSVFKVTNEAEIHSGEHHFKLKNYNAQSVPVKDVRNPYTTLFILPFKELDLYDKVKAKLVSLDVRTLLFLKHIETVEWVDQETKDKREYCKEYTKYENTDINRVNLLDSLDRQESWLVFSKQKQGPQDRKLSVDIAYLLTQDEKNQNYKIIPVANSCFSILVATKQETKCNFLINGNFRPVFSRENLTEDDERNGLLINLAADLLVDSMYGIKQAGLFSADFLDILPLNEEVLPEFELCLYNKVAEAFSQDAFLPTEDKAFTTPEQAIILETKKLFDFYTGSKSILDLKISDNVVKYLRDKLGVESIDTTDFVNSLSEEYLSLQTDDWLIKFYEYMGENKSLWRNKTESRYYYYASSEGILLSKPIIRLEDGRMVRLKDKCFLPNPNIKIQNNVIKRSIAENKIAQAFFKNFDNITVADAVDYLQEEILSKYTSTENDISLEKYKQDIETITKYLSTAKEDRQKLLKFCRKYNLILCVDNKYRKIKDVYCSTALLQEYFRGCNVAFANPDIFDETISKSLGILTDKPYIKIIEDSAVPSGQSAGTAWEHRWAYIDTDSPETILDENQAIAFAKCMTNLFKNPYVTIQNKEEGDEQLHICKSLYEWFYRKWNKQWLDSPWKQKMQSIKWVLNKKGELVAPNEVQISDIHESMDFLAELPDDFFGGNAIKIKQLIEQAEKETGQKLCVMTQEERKDYERLKQQEEAKLRKNKSSWKPDVPVNQCVPEDILFFANDPSNKKPGVINKPCVNPTEPSAVDVDNLEENDTLSAEDKKNIGAWGEEVILNQLKKNFPQYNIITLNSDTGTATGHDLQVFDENGNLKQYIEVKSTSKSLRKRFFDVSRSQWDIARDQGDKYWIYCVFEAGTRKPKIVKIQNPVEMFKQGDLEARPVKIGITPDMNISVDQMML